jgi:superoxide dismutase
MPGGTQPPFVEPTTTTDGVFKLPALPYSLDALEPHIDEATMRFHYFKHFNGYRTKLNAAAPASNLTEVQTGLDRFDTTIRNNGGGFWNHGTMQIDVEGMVSDGA